MSKNIQISILGKISGNVNADEVIGDRITIKKMYSTTGEVLPFVSSRAIKYSIRQAFKEKEFEIDPLYEDRDATGSLRLADSGRPDKYIDNDLFGYMLTTGRTREAQGEAFRRHAPIALSYFKALRDTPIKSEFAARFPRNIDSDSNPVPFEVEVAEFIGRLNVLIYDYIGDFTISTRKTSEVTIDKLEEEERKNRLGVFLDVLLTPSYVLPRRTNTLSIPEYYCSLISMSNSGVFPIYQYLDYIYQDNVYININRLNELVERKDIKDKLDRKEVELYLIVYGEGYLKNKLPDSINRIELSDFIRKAKDFLFSG